VNQLIRISAPSLPALVTAAGERASMRFLEFFAATFATRTSGIGSRRRRHPD
jgi:hypothetical protein